MSSKQHRRNVAAETMRILEKGGYYFGNNKNWVALDLSHVEDSLFFPEFATFKIPIEERSNAASSSSGSTSPRTSPERDCSLAIGDSGPSEMAKNAVNKPKTIKEQLSQGADEPKPPDEDGGSSVQNRTKSPQCKPPKDSEQLPPVTVSVTTETTGGCCRRLYCGDDRGDDITNADGSSAMTSKRRRKIACLNFASAKKPGGGWLNGAQAQEECLARASTLYPALLTHQNTFYMTRAKIRGGCVNNVLDSDGGGDDEDGALNTTSQHAGHEEEDGNVSYKSRRKRAGNTATNHHQAWLGATGNFNFYTDRIIYSPNVLFFRDDEDELLPEPFQVDVITCASVNQHALHPSSSRGGRGGHKGNKGRGKKGRQRKKGAGPPDPTQQAAVADIMTNRCLKILKCCVQQDVDSVVLGAWGTGVFGNEPEDVASYFREALQRLLNDGAFGRALRKRVDVPGGGRVLNLVFAIPDYAKAKTFAWEFRCNVQ